MMTARNGAQSLRLSWSRRVRNILAVIAALVAILLLPVVAHAVRADHGAGSGTRLEKQGKYEAAAHHWRQGVDFWAAMYRFWKAWGVYDTRGDEIYKTYVTILGTDKGYHGQHNEGRPEAMGPGPAGCSYLLMREGASRSVENGRLSREQRARLEDRARIHIEDIMDPEHGYGGDFSFVRKAWILERTGLFWHASFRRELAGRWALMVCSRYCDAIADGRVDGVTLLRLSMR